MTAFKRISTTFPETASTVNTNGRDQQTQRASFNVFCHHFKLFSISLSPSIREFIPKILLLPMPLHEEHQTGLLKTSKCLSNQKLIHSFWIVLNVNQACKLITRCLNRKRTSVSKMKMDFANFCNSSVPKGQHVQLNINRLSRWTL